MRIGIDLDNTIVSYEKLLMRIASRLGVKNITNPSLAKREIKNKLNEDPGMDHHWQRIQGLLYGRFLKYADPMPGVLNFLALCKVRGYEVFVVSHKTEFGHFDITKTPLRNSALRWLDTKLLDGQGKPFFRHDNIFFSSTQKDKISIIEKLDLDFFIDDLAEILNAINHAKLSKILFSNLSESIGLSWREISLAVCGVFTDKDCANAYNFNFPGQNVSVEQIVFGGNSRVFKVTPLMGVPVALKKYPPNLAGDRSRQFTETLAYRLLENSEYTAKLLYSDFITGYNIYSWINGEKVQSFSGKDLDIALGFIRELISLSKQSIGSVPMASEACTAVTDIYFQINSRLRDLSAIDDGELNKFLLNTFIPTYELAQKKIILDNGYEFTHKRLQEQNWILSPSDFGFHNSLKLIDGKVIFLDFEYFGFDDPAKLINDFVWHPGMLISDELKKSWTHSVLNLLPNDQSLLQRVKASWPLYGLRWALIVLKEFTGDGWSDRNYAQSSLERLKSERLAGQLAKSRAIIKNLTDAKMESLYV